MPTEAFLSRGVMLEWDVPAEAELIAGGTVELIRGQQVLQPSAARSPVFVATSFEPLPIA
jgi:hypothetical protein